MLLHLQTLLICFSSAMCGSGETPKMLTSLLNDVTCFNPSCLILCRIRVVNVYAITLEIQVFVLGLFYNPNLM